MQFSFSACQKCLTEFAARKRRIKSNQFFSELCPGKNTLRLAYGESSRLPTEAEPRAMEREYLRNLSKSYFGRLKRRAAVQFSFSLFS